MVRKMTSRVIDTFKAIQRLINRVSAGTIMTVTSGTNLGVHNNNIGSRPVHVDR